MKKERIKRNGRIFVIGGILIVAILLLTGCGKKENSSKTYEKESENQIQNIGKQDDNTTKQEKNETNNENKNDNKSENKNETKNTTNDKKENTSTTGNHKKSNELVVSREGSEEVVESKEYTSSAGYTIRYDSETFKASHHDNADWFERDEDINCVVVEKENIPYSKKISTLSNYKKADVNGYEAVYTTRRAEGQFVTTYYVNSGKDSTYIITESCQDSSEYLEGLGHIMDAMVQTFYIK